MALRAAGLDVEDSWDDFEPAPQEIESEDQSMRRRQRQFRMAAEAVAKAMSLLPEVEKVALFGSVARPLEKEVPRFRRFRRARIELFHECKDVDLAVWVSGVGRLKALQKARSRALNDLMAERNIGVAHHQVDVFFLEPGTDRYLGRLCRFGQCPKGKDECRVPCCGATPLLRQHERFRFDWSGSSQGHIVLYEKNGGK
jgi:predicted nucleotidyltransferase